MENLSIIFSVLATVIAIVSVVITHKYYKKSIKIEENRELDKKKARLTAKIEKRREQNSGLSSYHHWWIFQIENKGYADAYDIDVFITNKKFSECGFFANSIKLGTRIGSESSCTYIFKSADFRHQIPLHCVITWKDDSGKQGRWEHSLTES